MELIKVKVLGLEVAQRAMAEMVLRTLADLSVSSDQSTVSHLSTLKEIFLKD